MLKVNINNSQVNEVQRKDGRLFVNGIPKDYELIRKTHSSFILIKASKIYNVEVLSTDGKNATLSIDNDIYNVEISDHIDQILEELGMDIIQTSQVKEIKAPMPGSILNIMVEEKEEVKIGDPILVLEAMKMENVIKSPGDGVVNKIHVSEKENVEKNQVLITFD